MERAISKLYLDLYKCSDLLGFPKSSCANFCATFKSRSALAKNTIKKIYEKFTLTAYLSNIKKPNKRK